MKVIVFIILYIFLIFFIGGIFRICEVFFLLMLCKRIFNIDSLVLILLEELIVKYFVERFIDDIGMIFVMFIKMLFFFLKNVMFFIIRYLESILKIFNLYVKVRGDRFMLFFNVVIRKIIV